MSVPTNEKGHPGGFVSAYQPMSGRTTHTVTSSYDLAEDLQFPRSLITYDKMRADPQIAGVLEALAQPILNAQWDLIAEGVPENVTEFVRTELGLYGPENPLAQFSHQGVSILDHIAEMTQTLMWAGFSVAEQTYTVAPPTPEQAALGLPEEVRHLRKLAPRPPRTIEKIEVDKDGGLKGIVQTPLNPLDGDITIPVKQLVFYSHNKIGGAWEGQSVLRPTYRPWAMKDMYLRLDLKAVDQHSTGFWRGKTSDAKRRDALYESLANLRSGQETVIVTDAQDEVNLLAVNGQLVDVVARLNYLDREISRSALAQFLDLGHDNGARALGETHLKVFITKCSAIANYIARTVTQHIIRDLVRLNFPEGTPYPVLTPGDLRAQQGASAETLKQLMDAGAITYDRTLENFTRERAGYPVLDEDAGPRPAEIEAQNAEAARNAPPPVQVGPGLATVTEIPTAVTASEQTAYERATSLYQQLQARVGAR